MHPTAAVSYSSQSASVQLSRKFAHASSKVTSSSVEYRRAHFLERRFADLPHKPNERCELVGSEGMRQEFAYRALTQRRPRRSTAFGFVGNFSDRLLARTADCRLV